MKSIQNKPLEYFLLSARAPRMASCWPRPRTASASGRPWCWGCQCRMASCSLAAVLFLNLASSWSRRICCALESTWNNDDDDDDEDPIPRYSYRPGLAGSHGVSIVTVGALTVSPGCRQQRLHARIWIVSTRHCVHLSTASLVTFYTNLVPSLHQYWHEYHHQRIESD